MHVPQVDMARIIAIKLLKRCYNTELLILQGRVVKAVWR